MASEDSSTSSDDQEEGDFSLQLFLFGIMTDQDVELPYEHISHRSPLFRHPPVNVPRDPNLFPPHAPPPDTNNRHVITPKIQRVPPILLDEIYLSPRMQNCYKPLVISLGPYHYGTEKLQPMEKVKRSMLRCFVMGVGGDSIHDKCVHVYNRFRDIVLETNVKQCYVHERRYSGNFGDGIFFLTLLVDVCFIIQFIQSCVDRQERQLVTVMKTHEFALVMRDLFLLQNQIPFPVIKAMMMLKFSQGQIFEMIDKFIDMVVSATLDQQDSFQDQGIMRRFFPRKDAGEPTLPDLMTRNDRCDPIHLLHALQMRLVDPEKLTLTGDESEEDIWYSYRSVMELKAAGINFRPGRRFGCFTDISFKDNPITGTLTIPPMRVDDSTKAMLLNLVAFEMLPDGPDTLGVTSYLCLMDSLIDTAEDVKELRLSGIIANFLGSDQQVADLFNEIAGNLVRNPDAYVQVTSAIERHYKNTARIWMSEWLHAHFSTPWTAIAFLFAILGIALSTAQTYFAVFPRNS
ncbi:hypothetical protein Ancab_039927 [Ancistrocladus abbreviatus]